MSNRTALGGYEIQSGSHIAPGARHDNLIQLAAGLMKTLSYDRKTGDFTWLEPHMKAKRGSVAGGKNKPGYWRIKYQGRYFLAHRLAWLFTYGVWPEGEIDHIDGDKINNRISNLRVATRSQNEFNKHRRGYYLTKFGKYHSSICVDGYRRYLGDFATEAEAKYAYELASLKYHGEFSFLCRPVNEVEKGQ